jgi:Na+/melibiose symporter-like transporter
MTALYVILAVLLLIDWRQSLVIARPGGWQETWNPVLRWLGDRFGARGVHFWFAVVAVGLALAMWWLPEWAVAIAIAAIGVEVAATVNNWRLGIKP